MAKDMNTCDWVSFVLLVVGGLNWGLVGLGGLLGSNWNLVQWILGGVPVLRDLVYLVVGLAAVWALVHVVRK